MLRENFNKAWTFYKEGHEHEAINVDLPHDAMIYEKRVPNCQNSFNTGYFPGGVYALKAIGQDLAYIDISLADENGIVKPLVDRKVSIKVEGEGTLLGFGSANPFTGEVFNAPEHATYYGRALAVVRSGYKPGKVKVTISANGCETREIVIPLRP
nr:hypothetical protein [Candidatus Sigynarchaeum springense]